MLTPSVRLMNEYKPLLVKLHQDATSSEETKEDSNEGLQWLDRCPNYSRPSVYSTDAKSNQHFNESCTK
jgi:hypothetical protein